MLDIHATMNDPKINQLLLDIERKAGNDFELLEECGAEYFSTSDLLEMRGKWREQMRIYRHLHKTAIIIAAVSPIWALIGYGFIYLNQVALAVLSLFLVPFSFLIFGALFFYLRRQFKSYSFLNYVGRLIETELTYRQDATTRKRQR